MKCWKCGKDMTAGEGLNSMWGIEVKVSIETCQKTPEQIAYNNRQLGKFSDGKGECQIGLCYECYIDALFNIASGSFLF